MELKLNFQNLHIFDHLRTFRVVGTVDDCVIEVDFIWDVLNDIDESTSSHIRCLLLSTLHYSGLFFIDKNLVDFVGALSKVKASFYDVVV
jgi:hypothetical protein